MKFVTHFIVIPALCLLSTTAATAFQGAASRAEKLFNEGLSAIRSGNFTEAESRLRAGLRVDPSSAAGYDLLGVAEDGLGDLQEAERVYRKALALNPAFLAARNDLGRNLYQQGKAQAAAEEFKLALKIRPEDFTANYNLGIILLKAQKFSQAAEHLEAARRQDPSDLQTLLALTNSYLGAGWTERAKGSADEIVSLSPHDPRVSFSLGTLFLKFKQYQEAAELLDSARLEAPENFDLLFNLGQVYTRLHKYSKAEDAFLKALSVQEDSVDTLYQLAVLYTQSGHPDQAVRVLVRARELAPARPDILLLLGRVLINQGFIEDAINVLQDCVRVNPGKIEPYLLLGEGLTRDKQFAKAAGQYERAAQLDPENPQAQVGIGRSLLYMGRDSDADHVLRAALKRDSGNLGAAYYLGLLAERHADDETAKSWFEQVLKSDPRHFGALYEMGVVGMKQHDFDRALEYFQLARNVNPAYPETYYRLAAVYRRLGKIPQAKKCLAMFRKYNQTSGSQQKDYPPGVLEFVAKTQNLPQRQRLERYGQVLLRAEREKPNDVNVLLALARIYLRLGQKQEAMKRLARISALRPHDVQLQLLSASLLTSAHCFPKAEEYLKAVLSEHPNQDVARLNLASIYYQTYRDSDALDVLLSAGERLKQTAAYHDLIGRIMDRTGDPIRSLHAFQQAVLLDPNNDDYIVDLAFELMTSGRVGAARQVIEQARAHALTNCKLLFAKGIWNELEHHWTEASDSFQQAVNLSWRWEPAYLALANLLGETRSISKGLDVLSQAELLFPSSPWPHLVAALILIKTDSSEQGISELSQSLNLAAIEPEVYPALLAAELRRHDCEKARQIWNQMTLFRFGNELSPVRWCVPGANNGFSDGLSVAKILSSNSTLRLLMNLARSTPAN